MHRVNIRPLRVLLHLNVTLRDQNLKKQKLSAEDKEKIEQEIQRIKKLMDVPIKPTATNLYWFSHKGFQ